MSDAYGRVIAPFTVRFERLLPEPIERVWEYIVDGEKRGRWICSGVIEPRVGGGVELNFKHADLSPVKEDPPPAYERLKNGHIQHGKVLAIDPPYLLRVTWSETEPSEVTFELEETGDKVLLTITHRKLRDQGSVLSVGSGWHTHLAILRDVLEGATPRPFWSSRAKVAEYYEKEFAKE